MARFNVSEFISNQTDLLISVFKRFYLVALAALLLTFLSIYLVENGYDITEDDRFVLTKIIMMLGLSIPLFLSLQLWAEKTTKELWKIITGAIVIIILLTLYYFSLKGPRLDFDLPPNLGIRYGALLLATHGLVAISIYNRYADINGFWQFNKHLLLRTVTGIFYSGVLYLGMIAALFALDALFNIKIDSETYFQLFIFMAGTYNTFFVVGGIKKPLDQYANETEYPNSLKIFTQYVLLPLMALYLIILYAYMVKIIFLWSLPKGWVSNLVLCFSIAGILAFLLVYPIREREGNKWVKSFSKAFHYSLLPLILLLHISIWTRIGDYGITPERYIVMGLTLWLTFITAYFLISKRDNIIWIPASLAFIFAFATFGPWGFEKLSKYSQQARFENLLSEAGILNNDIITPLKNSNVPDSVKYRINEMGEYMVQNYTHNVLREYNFKAWNELADSFDNVKDKYYYFNAGPFMKKINLYSENLKWTPYGNTVTYEPSYYIYLDANNKEIDIAGFNKMEVMNISNYTVNSLSKTYLNNNQVVIKINSSDSVKINVLTDIKPFLSQCKPSCPALEKPITVDTIIAEKNSAYRILITGGDMRNENGITKINSLNGYILSK